MSYQDLSDTDLASACQRGEERGWAELYRRHGPTLARFLRRLLGPAEDLDDVLQQVFVACYTGIGAYRGDAKLTTWLYRVANNVGAQHIRTASRHRRKVQAMVHDQTHSADAAPDAHGAVEARQALLAVDQVLDELKPKLRTVWVMREVEHLSVDEIAAVLGIRRGTIRSRLLAARRQVLDGLSSAGHEAPGGRARFVGVVAIGIGILSAPWADLLGGMR